MPHLKTLLLTRNHISKVSVELSQFMPNVESLVLTDNDLTTVEELRALAGFKKLRNLVLLGNMVCELPEYRQQVIAMCAPSLKYLDF